MTLGHFLRVSLLTSLAEVVALLLVQSESKQLFFSFPSISNRGFSILLIKTGAICESHRITCGTKTITELLSGERHIKR